MPYFACRPAELAWTRQRRGGLVAVGVIANEITLREGLNMQPPKEQYSKSAVMDNETPLLVLKPSLSGTRRTLIVWVLFFVLFLRGSLRFLQGSWEYMSFMDKVDVLGCIFVFLCGIVIADILFVRSFKLYSDRVEKDYIFWKKTVSLKDAKVNVSVGRNMFLLSHLYVAAKGNVFYSFWNSVAYNLGLGDVRVDANAVIDLCKSIGIEFKDSSNFLNERYEQA